jgi:hypothetical protein
MHCVKVADRCSAWQARNVVLDVVKKLAEDMGIRDGQPHAAFPLEYILEVGPRRSLWGDGVT